MVAGLVLGLVETGAFGFPGELLGRGVLGHLAGLVAGFLLAYPFYAAGGLKAGDGKLLMAVGALRGVQFLIPAAIWGALAGGIIAAGFIVARRLARPAAGEPPTTVGRLMHAWIPYGVALGIGAMIALAVETRV